MDHAEHGLRVQLASYNAGEQFDAPPVPDLTEWLIPTVSESRRSGYATGPQPMRMSNPVMERGPREAPDVYAVAFQEFAPLHCSLSGRTSSMISRVDTEIRRAIRLHQSVVRDDHMYDPLELGGGPENYVCVAQVSHAGLVLYVYVRERPGQSPAARHRPSAAQRVKEVRTAFVGTGLGSIMGNKGAVGVRLSMASLMQGAPDEVLTFVCAHLAAHDHQVARRNNDWRQIVQRLVFEPEGVVPLPKLQPPENVPSSDQRPPDPLDPFEYSLYDTHHLFVLGDLNYRVATGVAGVPRPPDTKPPPPIDSKAVRDVARSFDARRWASILLYDQLLQEHTAGRTLQGLHLPDLAHWAVPPTYKYKAGGEMLQLSQKRLPGWPDRLLWGSSDAARGSAVLACELYRSLLRYTASDHKPITAIVQLPLQLDRRSVFMRRPFDIDPQWRRRRIIGVVLDRVVGYLWSFLLLFGNGNLYLAFAELALLGLLSWYWLQGRWL